MVNSHDYRKHTNVDSNWGPCPISGHLRRLEDVGNILQELHDSKFFRKATTNEDDSEAPSEREFGSVTTWRRVSFWKIHVGWILRVFPSQDAAKQRHSVRRAG